MELLVIVILLGIVAFITINKTSYAFAMDDKKALQEMEKLIEIQAEDYAMDNLSIFEESETTFITVADLVEHNYMIGDKNGNVLNPSDNRQSYNENKIKLEYNSDKNTVTATFLK